MVAGNAVLTDPASRASRRSKSKAKGSKDEKLVPRDHGSGPQPSKHPAARSAISDHGGFEPHVDAIFRAMAGVWFLDEELVMLQVLFAAGALLTRATFRAVQKTETTASTRATVAPRTTKTDGDRLEGPSQGNVMTVEPMPRVFFDGACPLSAREIAFYRNQKGASGIAWVDVSRTAAAELPRGLSRHDALARVHVQTGDGRLIEGAAAFAHFWSALPRFHLLGKFAHPPGSLGS